MQEKERLEAIGLSPLARGTRVVSQTTPGITRFIPAGAGNTSTDSIKPRWISVYPRWRGEHGDFLILNHDMPGLSPLARGTRQNRRPDRRR